MKPVTILPLAKLGIAARDLGAMLATLQDLEAKRIKPVLMYDTAHFMTVSKIPDRFAMSWSTAKANCGTAACIAGHMAVRLGLFDTAVEDYMDAVGGRDTKQVHALFCPSELGGNFKWSKIKPKHGAKAIRNFLSTGRPQWLKVMGMKKPDGYIKGE